ncbi:MAG: hypothetical protein WCE81_11345 [Halobacteriota archaeon]
MTQTSETSSITPQEVPRQSRLNMLVSFPKILLMNPGAFRNLRAIAPNEERYVRPPRRYEIPPFHKDMKCCTSNEK